jgi:Fe-S oxidoreductase
VADENLFSNLFREQIARCSRCGFCQVSCPVYEVTLRPAVNPRGKMLLLKELQEGRLALGPDLLDSFYQCTACALCSQHCPAGVQVPEILKAVRQDCVRAGVFHPAFKGLAEALAAHKNIYGLPEHPADFPALEKKPQAAIVYFKGCVGSFREAEATRQTQRLLDRLQVDYTVIEEVCCGGVLAEVGWEESAALAEHNIQAILASGAKRVLTECPFCYRTFTGRPAYKTLQEEKIEVLPLVRFLLDFNFGVSTAKRVTYHDPCDLGRHSGIYEEPRQIIRRIAPDFVEMAQNRAGARCCGAGSGMRGAYPGTSIALAARRLRDAVEIKADILLTHCHSCLHNFCNAQKRYAALRKQPLEVYNLSHFINRLLEGAA